eukprot:4755550-Alexandrium_andersonii.AAC.1
MQEWPAGSVEAQLAGKPLADGHFCVLLSLKGDLDYFTQTLSLRHYNSNMLCDFCPALRTTEEGM